MQDTGGQIVQKPVTVETATGAVTLEQANATVRLVSLEHAAIRVCMIVSRLSIWK